LKQIVVNKAINQLRARRLMFVDLEESRTENLVDESDEYICEEDLASEVSRVNDALMKLPSGYRSVLSLYLIEGYDHEEISEMLGISESTSRTQFMRGKKKLLKLLR
jgi:RNA polymerase sigma factor (sigma-70 family)